jgi:hypothetical protein
MSRPVRLRERLDQADAWAGAILIIAPIALFTIPSILGHPPIIGDNLIQNFPLRVLTGQILASGHLPEWNTLSNSGTPLLGGLNAGSFYPLTLPFAVLPAIVAWVVNMAACYVAAGLGLYVLARWLGLAPIPAFLGAITYAFMGMMVAQMVHLGVIQGQGWLPWVILAMLVATRRLKASRSSGVVESLRAARWPLAGLVVLVGLVFLTGEPRSIADLEMVAIVVAIWCVFFAEGPSSAGKKVLVAASLGVAALWGVLLSAIQLFPGESFIGISQRSTVNLWFFGSGSLSLNKTILLFVPDLFGGAGLFHQPTYFIDYNLSEVSGYVGMLGLAALLAAVTQLFGRSRRTQPVWLPLFAVLSVVGLLLAWGEFTPFVHLMVQIPLLNHTRLQSRNLVIFDLGVAVLVAWFADRILKGDLEGASLRGWRRWATVAPLAFTALFSAVTLVFPGFIEGHFGAVGTQGVEGHFLLGWFAGSLLLSLTAIACLVIAVRWSPARRRAALVTFVVLDVVFFMVSCGTGLTGGSLTEPSPAYAGSVLGTQGRSGIVDSSLSYPSQLVPLGQPNTNVFTKLPSVQGYGSLVGAGYGAATGVHVPNGIDPCALTKGTFLPLRLKTLVVAAVDLAPQIAEPGQTTPWQLTLPTSCPGQAPVRAGNLRPFYFGASYRLSSVMLKSRDADADANASLAQAFRVDVLDASGRRHQVAETIHSSKAGWQVRFASASVATGVVVLGPVHSVMESSTITDASGASYSLNGHLQDALDRVPWRLKTTLGNLQVFTYAAPIPPSVQLLGAGSGSKVLSTSDTLWGAETDVVHLTTRGTVLRSEAFLPGWRVTLTSIHGGVVKEAVVVQHGLIQSVAVPTGTWKMTWTYHAPRLALGMLVSGLAALALIMVVLVVGPRRRRKP